MCADGENRMAERIQPSWNLEVQSEDSMELAANDVRANLEAFPSLQPKQQ
jgi:hypothetical protein